MTSSRNKQYSISYKIHNPALAKGGVVVNRFESGRHFGQGNTKTFTTGMEHSVS